MCRSHWRHPGLIVDVHGCSLWMLNRRASSVLPESNNRRASNVLPESDAGKGVSGPSVFRPSKIMICEKCVCVCVCVSSRASSYKTCSTVAAVTRLAVYCWL